MSKETEDPSTWGPMCGRCYDFVDELFPAPCNEKPEDLLGQPIGQYHCPDCGRDHRRPHPTLCKRCSTFTHPYFDKMVEEENA